MSLSHMSLLAADMICAGTGNDLANGFGGDDEMLGGTALTT